MKFLDKNGIFVPSLINIALMFGIGMGLGSIVTFFIFIWMFWMKKIKLHL